jgi:hypothetical protein
LLRRAPGPDAGVRNHAIGRAALVGMSQGVRAVIRWKDCAGLLFNKRLYIDSPATQERVGDQLQRNDVHIDAP